MPQSEIGSQASHLNEDKIFDKRRTFMEAFSMITISDYTFQSTCHQQEGTNRHEENYFLLARGDGCMRSKKIFTSCLQCIQVRNGALVFS